VTEQLISDGVFAPAEAYRDLSERATLVILAALDGDDTLTTEQDIAPTVAAPPAAAEDADATTPVGAYLTSIDASGFRGAASATSAH
jgi:hypothetical protein